MIIGESRSETQRRGKSLLAFGFLAKSQKLKARSPIAFFSSVQVRVVSTVRGSAGCGGGWRATEAGAADSSGIVWIGCL